MSKLTSDDLVRAALWEAHGKRCFWHGEPIEFAQLEIDHLIPESFENKTLDLKNILKGASLPEDYDLQGLQNLVPSCKTCNGRKSAHVYSAPQLISLTHLADRILPKVETILKSKRDRMDLEETYINAIRANGNGRWKISDLVAKFRDGGHIEFAASTISQNHTLTQPPKTSYKLSTINSESIKITPSSPVFLTARAAADLHTNRITIEDLQRHLVNSKEVKKSMDGVKSVVSRINDSERLYISYQISNDGLYLLSCHIVTKAA